MNLRASTLCWTWYYQGCIFFIHNSHFNYISFSQKTLLRKIGIENKVFLFPHIVNFIYQKGGKLFYLVIYKLIFEKIWRTHPSSIWHKCISFWSKLGFPLLWLTLYNRNFTFQIWFIALFKREINPKRDTFNFDCFNIKLAKYEQYFNKE